MSGNPPIRRIKQYKQPIAGYVVLKFYAIESIPLVSLRNLDDSGHCEESFMHFCNRLCDETSDSLEEGSIDLKLYEQIVEEIKDQLFMTVGYTTNPDIDKIRNDNQDCEHLVFFHFSDIVYGTNLFKGSDSYTSCYIVSNAYYQERKQEFQLTQTG